MTTKTWIIFAAICVVLFGALVYISGLDKVDVSKVDGNSILKASSASGDIADRVDGNASSKVVLIEYGDFQCPGCGSAHPNIKQVVEKYNDKIAFVFRNFPLVDRHPNARAAAAAAETAGLMGKYWEMHNLLFENQDEWSDASGSDRMELFKGYASDIGLDADKFEATLTEKSTQINRKIDFDRALGRKAGVDGTPSFYLNGKKVDTYALDGKAVSASTPNAQLAWSDAEAFEALVILPALKEAGIDTE